MNYQIFARWVVALLVLVIVTGIAGATYHTQTMWGPLVVGVFAALMVDGFLPHYVCAWLTSFLLLAGLCTLIIVFPVHTIAVFFVFGTIFGAIALRS